MNMLTFYLAIILFDFVFEAQNYSFYSIPQNVFRIILDNKFVLGSVPSAKQGAVPSAKAQKKAPNFFGYIRKNIYLCTPKNS